MTAGHFRIRITRVGWLFILLCLGVGISALNTGNNLLYLVFGMMLSFLILSGLLSNNSLKKLRIQPIFPQRIFANNPIGVQLRLKNEKRWVPSFAISLRPTADVDDLQGGTFVIKIPPQSTESTTDHVRFPKRGWTKLPDYRAETTYPFGLIQKGVKIESEGDAMVYPELLPVDTLIGRQQRLSGEFLSGEKGGMTNPYGIRDYVPGDPARLIHWKSSAKQQKWRIKEFEREKRLRVLIDVNLVPSSSADPALTEKALSVAASFIVLLSKRGFELGLRINGSTVEAEGRGYLDAYLSALAVGSPPTEALPTTHSSLEGNSVICVSDYPSGHLLGDIVYGRETLEEL